MNTEIKTEDEHAYGTFEVARQNFSLNKNRRNRLLFTVAVAFCCLGTIATLKGYFYNCTTQYLSKNKIKKSIVLSTLEKKLLSIPKAESIKNFLHAYSSKPHSAGTKGDYETALYTLKKFQQFGIAAELKTYYVLLSTPVHRKVGIVSPLKHRRNFELKEGVIDADQCTNNQPGTLPPFIAYSSSGNVTSSIVYANYGTEEDFVYLQRQNVSLKDKIALVRYGQNFRGLKVMLAASSGMAGVLIYSDPRDDGYGQGKVYPDGPWRPSNSYQRGSAQYVSLYAGDPLTPGYASTLDAPRLSIEDATSMPHIPVQVLSYGEAVHILKALEGGTVAPQNWQGGLPLKYCVANEESPVIVHMDLNINNYVGPIWNVIGKIKGESEPDKNIILGNHRDAWVCGAVDPNSGSATMLEIARSYGIMLKQGWKPRRSIIFASWDGEEYGLLGSTEYAEDYREMLSKETIAYINVDNLKGNEVYANSAPCLGDFLLETSKSVEFNSSLSLYDKWMKQFAVDKNQFLAQEKVKPGAAVPPHPVSFLGSGTDFTPFFQHLGIISANIGFNITTYGVYHSTMDSIMYMEKYGDPNYKSHMRLTKWWGLIGFKLADLVILPINFEAYTKVMHPFLIEFETETNVKLKMSLNYTKVHKACDVFLKNAKIMNNAIQDLNQTPMKITKADARLYNEKLMYAERAFLSEKGLKHRPWYKHLLFGPGYTMGYGATAYPGIADAILFKDDEQTIQAHLDELASAILTAGQSFR